MNQLCFLFSLFSIFVFLGCQQIRYNEIYTNPVIPGCYPDPSICRVGDDYYTVHSSFEYFPGVPIFHSRDLVHWRQIGYCLTRESQLPLKKMRTSGGIYAPTLRYHNGLFYMITTNVDGGGNFYVTAKDPRGPWSDPVWLDKGGFDPSLFFDDDGKVYYTRHEGEAHGYIAQCLLDLKEGKLEGEMKKIWEGTGDIWPEGPHLYKINGKYYLMIAEGGTSYGHMITIARSESPWGPFEPNPNNPILTHKHLKDHPFQALGHGDLVETPDGWWIVFLGIRPKGGYYNHLGRETFLAPVKWTKDGWPIVNEGKPIEEIMKAPRLPRFEVEEEAVRDDFDKEEFSLCWNFLRNPYIENYSLTERPGYLRLYGSEITMADQDSPTFLGRRQTAMECKVVTKLEFNPQKENEEAGLVIRGNEANRYELGITKRDGKRCVFLRKTVKGKLEEPIKYEGIGEGEVILSIEAKPLSYEFFYQVGDEEPKSLGTALTKYLSFEEVESFLFTGAYIGLYATGNGVKSTAPADFDWFDFIVYKK
ncbi:MAG: glycoside hydrolase family 43 protein [candidate division WOR-3 bacterium]